MKYYVLLADYGDMVYVEGVTCDKEEAENTCNKLNSYAKTIQYSVEEYDEESFPLFNKG